MAWLEACTETQACQLFSAKFIVKTKYCNATLNSLAFAKI